MSVITTLRSTKPPITVKERNYRKIKSINIDSLTNDLAESDLCKHTPDELNNLVDCYNTTLAKLLDKHAPLQTKRVSIRPRVPWYNKDILTAKRKRRQAERKWRLTKSADDLKHYKLSRNFATNLMNKARTNYYENLIEENISDQAKLFKVAKHLLTESKDVHLPPCSDTAVLANDFGNYFVEKIAVIRSGFPDSHDVCYESDQSDVAENPDCKPLDNFVVLSEEEVRDIILKSSKKTCVLDPMPTSLIIKCMDILLPVLTIMVNMSLQNGYFADKWKEALVLPILKKIGLELLFNNYRPVSNLPFVSKVTERAVFAQSHQHMMLNNLYPSLQSAYRQNHSTETALLKVRSDILMKMNSQNVVLLVLLDLSAAFDTVDHKILLSRLHSTFGVTGKSLDWFASYLTGRSQRVHISGVLSKNFQLDCGVPQGSCLGPLLYIIYASKLFDIIEKHLPDAHCFADDTQLYLSFKPDNHIDQDKALASMENCLRDIRSWMKRDKLLLNDGKTEFLIIGTRQQLAKVDITQINIGDSVVDKSKVVRNLGSWFDEKFTMETHINKVCKTAFYHLHNIRRIRKYLSPKSAEILVHAFITARLDYCNSLLFGLPQYQLAKLQRVQNAAARLICKLPRFSHITPVLCDLHWLPINYRIEFKILLITFKAIHGTAPGYICDTINVKKSSRYNLRNNNETLLVLPSGKSLATLGDRAFAYAAPKLWNSLPRETRDINVLSTFKSHIKTLLFRRAFNS